MHHPSRPAMSLSKETFDELEGMRMRLLQMLVPLQASEEADDRVRLALWAAVQELDPLLRDALIPADLDLTKDDPATQQLLYALTERDYFLLQPLADPGDIHVPLHTPEECGLRVFFEYGRWFVTWLKLEEDVSQPEAMSRELLVFERDLEGKLVFTEV